MAGEQTWPTEVRTQTSTILRQGGPDRLGLWCGVLPRASHGRNHLGLCALQEEMGAADAERGGAGGGRTAGGQAGGSFWLEKHCLEKHCLEKHCLEKHSAFKSTALKSTALESTALKSTLPFHRRGRAGGVLAAHAQRHLRLPGGLVRPLPFPRPSAAFPRPSAAFSPPFLVFSLTFALPLGTRGRTTTHRRRGRATTRWCGHPHNMDYPPTAMALITSDCGATRYMSIKWP